MKGLYLLIIGLLVPIISYLSVAAIRRSALRRKLLDVPNERSSHTNPTPRGGGFAIAVIVLVGFVVCQIVQRDLPKKLFFAYLLGAIIVSSIGGIDDIFTLSAKIRLPIHLLAAFVFAFSAGFIDRVYLPFIGDVNLGWLGLPFTVLWIAGFTNAFNFMDGIDGIAAGQAIVAGLCWIVVSIGLGTPALTTLGGIVTAASLGFLFHNTPPAKIFMGDAGSTLLGYTFATLPVLAFRQTGDSRLFIVGALCVGPFVFDATLTILRRALQKEQLLQAHRSHLYQRLVKLGYFHGSVTLLYLVIAFLTSAMALAYLWGTDRLSILALCIAGMLLGLVAVGVTWLEHSEAGS